VSQTTFSASSFSDGGAFTIVPRSGSAGWLNKADIYSAAMAYVRGEVDVYGDLVAAVRYFLTQAPDRLRARVANEIRMLPWRLSRLLPERTRVAHDIQFHYDRSNEFYGCFLDAGMVYSCAYFQRPDDSLETAQQNKLQHICRKLRLAAGDNFLDIGCGWGGLLLHAAQQFGAQATGCTLSRLQALYAAEHVQELGLEASVSVRETDYRNVTGTFDKIASVGMFEHVERKNLPAYLSKVFALLRPGGLFLNHGITIPEGTSSSGAGVFISRAVFPQGELLSLGEVISTAERCGFEILDVESLRRHYARTCREWVNRLQESRDRAIACAGERTWRTWSLYLAGSSAAFETGRIGIHQILMAKPPLDAEAPMTRQYMYSGTA
jgi:cyclopropane-fatty-acyl-phospholipid synthase